MSLKDWYCKKCSLQFNKKSVFIKHVSIVHNQKVEKEQKMVVCKRASKELFQCYVCDTQFKRKHSLKTHTASVQEQKKHSNVMFATTDVLPELF